MNLLYSLLSASLVVAVALGSTTDDPGTVPTDNGDTDSPGGPDPTTPGIGTTDDGYIGSTEPATPGIETLICEDGRCYSLTAEAGTWEDAGATCSKDLTVLDTDAEKHWVHANLNRLLESPTSVWIGAERRDNVTTWITGEDLTDELDGFDDFEDGCVIAQPAGADYVWYIDECDGPHIGLCEQPEAAGGDGGLSDGEIAAIAVSSSLVVGGAAAGGGYYAYSKSKGAIAPAGGSQGDMTENKEEEEEKEEEETEQVTEEV